MIIPVMNSSNPLLCTNDDAISFIFDIIIYVFCRRRKVRHFFELCQLRLHMQGSFVLYHVLHLLLAHLVNFFRLDDHLVLSIYESMFFIFSFSFAFSPRSFSIQRCICWLRFPSLWDQCTISQATSAPCQQLDSPPVRRFCGRYH